MSPARSVRCMGRASYSEGSHLCASGYDGRVVGKVSAGLLMYRRRAGALQVLLVHPGGPFFRHKDEGAWSIPKGEPNPGEELRATALREFHEEVGFPAAE